VGNIAADIVAQPDFESAKTIEHHDARPVKQELRSDLELAGLQLLAFAFELNEESSAVAVDHDVVGPGVIAKLLDEVAQLLCRGYAPGLQ